jgi:hypothetical protein
MNFGGATLQPAHIVGHLLTTPSLTKQVAHYLLNQLLHRSFHPRAEKGQRFCNGTRKEKKKIPPPGGGGKPPRY